MGKHVHWDFKDTMVEHLKNIDDKLNQWNHYKHGVAWFAIEHHA
jgi:hypothetical protein